MGNAAYPTAGIPVGVMDVDCEEIGVETRARRRRRIAAAEQDVVELRMETRRSRRRRHAAGECAICLEHHPCARPSVCEHLFHLDCLLQWCAEENSCPVCRTFFNHVLPGTGSPIPVDDAVQYESS